MNTELYLFFIANSVIGIMLLVFLKLNIGSVIAKFKLSVFALSIWIIPYHWLKNILPHSNELNSFWLKPIVTIVNTAEITSENFNLSSLITLNNLIIMFFSVGIALFINQIVIYFRWTKRLKNGMRVEQNYSAFDGKSYSVYSSPKIKTGFITGYFKPVIWINSSLVNTTKAHLIMAHEAQHLINLDHWKLLILGLIRSIYWWNPIVLILIKKITLLIESRCDLQTSKIYGRQGYIKGLAEIILNSSQLHPHRFINSISNDAKTNIFRLKILNKENIMTKKSILIYSAFTILCVFLLSMPLSMVSANEQKSVASDGSGLLLDFKIIEKITLENKTGNTIEEAEFSIWSHFDKLASIKIGDQWKLEITMHDKKDEVYLDMGILQQTNNKTTVVAQPKILATIGVESIIKWGDDDHNWEIQVTTHRTQRPQSK